MGLDRKCKVAIIGAGNMALEHAKAFGSLPNAELVGIFSRTKQRAQDLASQYSIPFVAESVKQLYDEVKPDLVVVTVYETSMLEVSLECMKYDWTIFLEKPPGYNVAQAQEIKNAGDAAGRKVIVALNRRFLSSTQNVLQSLQTNEGNRFVTVFDQQSLALARALNHQDQVVKHWMYANSIHLIDYINLFCRGDVESVDISEDWKEDKVMMINANIKFSSGDRGLYQGIWEAPGPWAVNVVTQDIRWEMRPLEKAVYQLAGERQLHPVEISQYDQDFKPGFRLQAEHAVNKAMNNDSCSPTMVDAIKTMEIINKVYKR